MTYLSIIEKLQVLFKTLLDFKFILVFTFLLLILTLLYIIRKLSGKKYILCMFLSTIVAFIISIIGNYNVLSNTFDNFTTKLFGNIYFPSIYVYIVCLVISFITFVTSMLNVMLKKIYKIINSVLFVINNILFIIILNIIARDNIDIFSVTSLYSDTVLVVMLELSMGVFILWILSLITVYVTDCICERITYKKTYNVETEEGNVFVPNIEVDDSAEVSSSDDKEISQVLLDSIKDEDIKIEENDNVINTSGINDDVDNYCNKTRDNITFNDILNVHVPVTYYNNDSVSEEHLLVDPYAIYEKKYQDINKKKSICETVLHNNASEKLELSLEDKTLREKEKRKEERLIINTVSLNDLIDDKSSKTSVKMAVDKSLTHDNIIHGDEGVIYTIDDYKKILKMLKALKLHANSSNIKIDDAVAISLISNYSIDDCMKFKNILESNLN